MLVQDIQQVTNKSAHYRVYDALKRATLSGFFRPGEQVTIRGLAQQLNIGEMPVREAVKRLVAERALEASPDRKFRVPVLDKSEIREILDLRIMLEGLAAEQAATKITDKQIERIKEVHAESQLAVDELDASGILKANTRFHFLIYQACENDTLLPIIESLWMRHYPTLSVYLPQLMAELSLEARSKVYTLAQHGHAVILEALENRDPKRAKKSLQADLRDFSKAADHIGDAIAREKKERPTAADYIGFSDEDEIF
jgi:DNA-binding GntR family transcriptional regulator